MSALQPWNNWYHCMGNTYGTWTAGDRRGFRTRHHRTHVEGDYKNPPPPGAYDDVLRRSLQQLKHEPIFLSESQRESACRLLAQALLFHRAELVTLCVSRCHFHLLARFTTLHEGQIPVAVHDPLPRKILGKAKSWCSSQLKKQGHFGEAGRGVWAIRSKIEPIVDRPHQLNVVRYIRNHAAEGGAVWDMVRGVG